jgi:hypothetical protein
MIDKTPTLWDSSPQETRGWFFIEFPGFDSARDDYFESDQAFADFQWDRATEPEKGDVMQGCGGLRKVRWGDARRGKGKRGGLRVIYLLVPEVRAVVLLDLYDKDEADDLTPKEKREVSTFAKEIKKHLMVSFKNRKGVTDDKS